LYFKTFFRFAHCLTLDIISLPFKLPMSLRNYIYREKLIILVRERKRDLTISTLIQSGSKIKLSTCQYLLYLRLSCLICSALLSIFHIIKTVVQIKWISTVNLEVRFLAL
jgi:hypothetical protein